MTTDREAVAVVTGAARGIGAATSVQLADDGWPLLLVDASAPQYPATYEMPTLDDLQAVADDCAAAGSSFVAILRADVRDRRFCAQVAEALAGRRVGAAVAAAGVIVGAEAWQTDEEAWDLLLGVNFHGVRRLAEAVIPSMLAAGEGRFVAVSSTAALRAIPKLAAYSAAKAAVVGYVRALAADLAGTGVTANAICPGSTAGAMLEASAEIYALPGQETFAEQHLVRRLLDPAEIAAAIRWLCHPEASAVAGAVIAVDGGLSA